MGKELKDDPEYQRRLHDPKYAEAFNSTVVGKEIEISKSAKISVSLFLFGALLRCVNGSNAFSSSGI